MTPAAFFVCNCSVVTKADLRETIAARIRSLGVEDRIVLDAQIATHVTHLPFWERAVTVFGYMGIDDEVDLQAVFRAAIREGKRIALPRVETRDGPMTFHLVGDFPLSLERHPYGFLQPPPEAPEVQGDLDTIVLVPGRAFDRQGRRLGRGGGYYDRFIAHTGDGPVTVGICYSAQVVQEVPVTDRDESVQIVVSDAETCFARRPGLA